jgi:hypothetical protein
MAIREYRYVCEKCSYEFSDFCDWADVANYNPACSMCRSNKNVCRDYGAESVGIDTGPKTVGMLADLNTTKGIKDDKEKEERNHEASYKVKKIGNKEGRAERIKKSK